MIDFFVKGGPLMWPILVCSVVALALIVAKALQFWAVASRLSDSDEAVLAKRPPEVAPILAGIDKGFDEKMVAFLGAKQVRRLEKGLGILSLVSVISPLLGFTGTVTGMIQAFMVIASQTAGRVEPSMVAGGIYEALITTAGGLFVAIPTHVALHFLEDRLDAISIRMKDVTLTGMERVRNAI
jgi:biopolymer transport protein ExbB